MDRSLKQYVKRIKYTKHDINKVRSYIACSMEKDIVSRIILDNLLLKIETSYTKKLNKAWRKKSYDKTQNAGICVSCRKPCDIEGTRCSVCKAARNTYARKLHKDRIDNELCVYCGKPHNNYNFKTGCLATGCKPCLAACTKRNIRSRLRKKALTDLA